MLAPKCMVKRPNKTPDMLGGRSLKQDHATNQPTYSVSTKSSTNSSSSIIVNCSAHLVLNFLFLYPPLVCCLQLINSTFQPRLSARSTWARKPSDISASAPSPVASTMVLGTSVSS